MNRASVRVTLATATSPGAVAIVQLSGAGIPGVFQELTGVDNWPIGRVRLVHFGDIDDGMAVLWREGWAQLMPHGGTRVVRKLLDRLAELGCVYENDPPARLLYPEATSDLEADMLATIARAASPAAIDLLLAQPRLWREFLPPLPLGEGRGEGTCESPGIVGKHESPSHPGDPLTRPRERGHPLPGGEGVKSILAGSATLDRLITPPCVVVVGRPNVGKSTLTNRMLGRAASIVADLPGTTRDWVAGLAEINGVAVRWLDTPGLRASDDPIEQRAIELAADAIRAADMVITMRDGEIDWPEDSALPRKPDIRVMNKADQSRQSVIDSEVIPISAATGEGVARLERAVVESLGLSVVTTPGLWAFSPELKRILSACDWSALGRYVKTSDSAQP